MAYYKYVEMNSLQSEEIVVLENIYLILNQKWNYKEVKETKKMVEMFEDSEDVIAKIMSIKEIDVTNRKALTFLTLTEEEKRLGMIEDPEKWIAEIANKQEGSGLFRFMFGPDGTSVEMLKALAKFFLKIAVYRFCMVHWPKLICQDKTIDRSKIETFIEKLAVWERDIWISVTSHSNTYNIFEERKQLISSYDSTYYVELGSNSRVSSVKSWIEGAYKNCKDKVFYEDAKKFRLKYIEENAVVERKDDSSHKGITEIENMRKLLDIMERHLSNNLTPQDIANLKENMHDWEKNTEKLLKTISNLSGF